MAYTRVERCHGDLKFPVVIVWTLNLKPMQVPIRSQPPCDDMTRFPRPPHLTPCVTINHPLAFYGSIHNFCLITHLSSCPEHLNAFSALTLLLTMRLRLEHPHPSHPVPL